MLLLIIVTILTILSYIIYEKHKTCFIVGLITSLVGWFFAALGVIPLLIIHFTALSPKQYREEIETQLDNINYRIHYYEITGELPDDLTILIDSYNDMISTGKKYQHSIWVGGIFPDIYDEYEYIEFKIQ